VKLRRARQTRRGRIEIIPMIDIMFFLLATFMLASLALQRLDALRVDLPAGHATPLAAPTPLTLSVHADDTLFVNRQPVTVQRLAATFAAQLPSDRTLVIAAAEHASNGAVMHAMLEARKAGVLHFSLAIRDDAQ
jgi:biopolymer transport protein ExbD